MTRTLVKKNASAITQRADAPTRVTLVISRATDREVELYTAAHGLKKKDVIARAIEEFLHKQKFVDRYQDSQPPTNTRNHQPTPS